MKSRGDSPTNSGIALPGGAALLCLIHISSCAEIFDS